MYSNITLLRDIDKLINAIKLTSRISVYMITYKLNT